VAVLKKTVFIGLIYLILFSSFTLGGAFNILITLCFYYHVINIPEPQTIKDLIFHGNQDPDHPALESPGQRSLTYRDLRNQVLLVIKTLNSLGFGRNDRISVIMPGGPETAVLGIGIMAGFTHAPLNPQYKDQEFREMFSRLNIKAVILQKNHQTAARAVALSQNIPVIEITPSPDKAGIFTIGGGVFYGREEAVFAQPDDTVIVMQTSGTTSVPKIVPLSQKQFCKSAYHYFSRLNLSDKDISLHIVAHFHILGITHTLLAPLLGGGTVVCARDYISPDFLPLLKTFRPTFYCAAPAHHKGILHELKKVPAAELHHHSLRYIRSTSSPLPAAARKELETLLNVPVIESYAMTESPVISINMPHKEGSAGIPMVESLVIMDEKGTILKNFENGEVAIRGDVVFSGYEDARENASAFTNGYFRTGDIGYLDNEGYLFLTGRKKELINKGGEKFSPQEIDAALVSHPNVREAMAFRIDDPVLGEDVAVMVVRADERVSEQDLRRYLHDRLIQFKVPRRIFFVDEIPKGPTGKLLRYAGTERYKTGSFEEVRVPEVTRYDISPERSQTEEKIMQIWTGILDCESLSTEDDFFHCGGNSLTAIELLIRIQRAFDVTFPPDMIYLYPTIRQQATLIAQKDHNSSRYHPLIVPLHEKGTLPPLFCFNPLGGWIKEYQYISRFFDPERPVFGIRARGLEPEEKPVATVEEAAREYLDAIKTVQKKGPYHLLGFSGGALYAYEVGCQLQNQGESVTFLGIIDMSLPAPLKRLFDISRGQGPNFLITAGFPVYSFLNNLLKKNPDSPLYSVFVKSVRIFSQGLLSLKGSSSIPESGSEVDYITDAQRSWISTLPEKQQMLVRTQIRAISIYKPRIFSGDVILFSTGPDREFYPGDPSRGWNSCISGKTMVIDIPGDHWTLYREPLGQMTAKKIEESLKEADTHGEAFI
jgi:acyl-coenzyme A synthetase/AMP-(fatty) acid ligase/thioesterase domain-containing protein/acyl carrier protein